MNTDSVDAYLTDGCGRCDKYRTPQCKVHRWSGALVALRELLQASGLQEHMKWGSPTYTLDGRNVVMLVSRAEHCALSFFKGAALADPDGALQSPGPNSRYARFLPFTSRADVERRREQAVRFIEQAAAIERAGISVVVDDAPEPMPIELDQRLDAQPDVRAAYDALTPGRRRSHILYVSGAKQSKTRENRAERCVPKILAGKGYNEY